MFFPQESPSPKHLDIMSDEEEDEDMMDLPAGGGETTQGSPEEGAAFRRMLPVRERERLKLPADASELALCPRSGSTNNLMNIHTHTRHAGIERFLFG